MNRADASTTPLFVEGGVLGVCPVCGGHDFVPVEQADETNFFCPGCQRCWHYSLGWISRTDPGTCASCSWKEQCVARFDEDARAHG